MAQSSKSERRPFLYVGIKGSVVALRKDDGEIAWATKLPRGSGLVALVVEDARVFAISGGEISCLDPSNGNIVWHNKLKGYGFGHGMLAGGQSPIAFAEEALVRAAQAASGGGL